MPVVDTALPRDEKAPRADPRGAFFVSSHLVFKQGSDLNLFKAKSLILKFPIAIGIKMSFILKIKHLL